MSRNLAGELPQLAAFLMIAGGCGFLGLTWAGRARQRCLAAEECIALLEFLADRIEAEAPELPILFAEAARSRRFSHLNFLPRLAENTARMPPGEAMTLALRNQTDLTAPVRDALEKIGEFIGLRDRKEVCGGLRSAAELLRSDLPELKKTAEEQARLYPTLGFLAGIFADILLL